MNGRDQFKKYKNVINFLSKLLFILPLSTRKYFWSKVNRIGGKKGVLLRYILIYSITPDCGDNVFIDRDVEIKNLEKLQLGNNVSIHRFCYLDALGGIIIGDDVSIAHTSSLVSFNHSYDNLEESIKYQELALGKIQLQDNVWVGAKSTILAGVTISSGCVVGAGSVVTKNFNENSVLVGVPAKIIKKRGEQE